MGTADKLSAEIRASISPKAQAVVEACRAIQQHPGGPEVIAALADPEFEVMCMAGLCLCLMGATGDRSDIDEKTEPLFRRLLSFVIDSADEKTRKALDTLGNDGDMPVELKSMLAVGELGAKILAALKCRQEPGSAGMWYSRLARSTTDPIGSLGALALGFFAGFGYQSELYRDAIRGKEKRVRGQAKKYGGSPEERKARALAVYDAEDAKSPRSLEKKIENKVKTDTGVAARTLRGYLQKRRKGSAK